MKNFFSNTSVRLNGSLANKIKSNPNFTRGGKTPVLYSNPVDAVRKYVKSGSNVYLHMGAATPLPLTDAVAELKDEVKGVKFYHMTVIGEMAYLKKDIPEGTFKSVAFFTSAPVRESVNSGHSDYMPMFFSEVPSLFRSGEIPLDVAFMQVSTPDKHGFVTLGTSVDCSLAGAECAKHVIAVINPNMPRTHGDGVVHISMFDALVETDNAIPVVNSPPVTDVEAAIGKHCAELIPNGATLQLGIGGIPNAVLGALTNHKDIGIHTELVSDGVLPLIKSGVINNSKKANYKNRIVTAFLQGTEAMYEYVDDNPEMNMLEVNISNDPNVIGANPDMHAINSAIEVDITGQVVADSIGTKIYSGIGGQMDFMRGAALSKGGKPIIALPSVTNKGVSRITPFLKPGGGVITTRGHCHYVVTEYGVAKLHGKTLYERAVGLTNIAHPDHRDSLFEEITKRFGKKVF